MFVDLILVTDLVTGYIRSYVSGQPCRVPLPLQEKVLICQHQRSQCLPRTSARAHPEARALESTTRSDPRNQERPKRYRLQRPRFNPPFNLCHCFSPSNSHSNRSRNKTHTSRRRNKNRPNRRARDHSTGTRRNRKGAVPVLFRRTPIPALLRVKTHSRSRHSPVR